MPSTLLSHQAFTERSHTVTERSQTVTERSHTVTERSRSDRSNETQPDALLRIEQRGQSIISDDDYVEGAPELIVEIAVSSASLDLGAKLHVYRRNQVQEYLVWRVHDHEFDWFKLQDSQYVQLSADSQDILRSHIFPGLWLDRTALLNGDLATVLQVLKQGLNTSEHQSFRP